MSHLPLPEAKRTAGLLALAGAIGNAGGPIAIGTGGLVGAAMLPPEQKMLATLPVSAFVVGSALASIPAALIMQRIGRRRGFLLGTGLGATGACLAGLAVLLQNFWLFMPGMALLGSAGAFAQQYRFAAADAAEPSFKPRAIAWVMAGGIVTGVVGPQLAIHSPSMLPAAPMAAPFFALAVLIGVSALVLAQLRVPPPPPIREGASGRPLRSFLTNGKFLVGLLASVGSYALMSLVMTATPLAMIEHHHSHADAQTGIQWHVIAMFGPSFFTGGLIARFGKSTIAASGLLLIAASATVALTGTSLWHFWTALILLGVGWNFGFIAATAMIASLYRPEESFRVQAMNEFILFTVVAIASFASGGLLVSSGWAVVNLVVYPVVALSVALIAMQAIRDRATPSPEIAQ